MNILEFISKFDDVIPYTLELNIGGSKKKDMITNKDLISRENFKGKMVPFYEMKFGKREVKYVPANEISLPINIKVDCDGIVLFDAEGEVRHVRENPITKTNKDWTRHTIRLINEEGKQYGCIMLLLNSSGDIREKTCFYHNKDFTHELKNNVDFEFEDNKIVRYEDNTYTEKDYENNVETVVTTYQKEGQTTGITIMRRKLRTREDILFQSITDLNKDFTSDDTYYYLAREERLSYQDAISGHKRSASENWMIRDDLTYYSQRKEYIDRHPNECSSSEWEYLQDETNNLLYGFIGEYTGNTILKKSDGIILIVRTSDSDFNYYTEIDLTGTDQFIGTNEFLDYEERDSKYFDRIKNSSKKPKFKTKIVNGEECLVPQNGDSYTEEELEEFMKFKSFYLESFDEISKIKTGKLLQKKK